LSVPALPPGAAVTRLNDRPGVPIAAGPRRPDYPHVQRRPGSGARTRLSGVRQAPRLRPRNDTARMHSNRRHQSATRSGRIF